MHLKQEISIFPEHTSAKSPAIAEDQWAFTLSHQDGCVVEHHDAAHQSEKAAEKIIVDAFFCGTQEMLQWLKLQWCLNSSSSCFWLVVP